DVAGVADQTTGGPSVEEGEVDGAFAAQAEVPTARGFDRRAAIEENAVVGGSRQAEARDRDVAVHTYNLRCGVRVNAHVLGGGGVRGVRLGEFGTARPAQEDVGCIRSGAGRGHLGL